MKIAILQLNFLVGDIEGNTRKILKGYKKACEQGAELVVTSELALLGYPPKDLLSQKSVIDKHDREFKKLVSQISNVGLVIGIVEKNQSAGKKFFNSMVLVQNGKILHTRRKELLPTYDVFDELRYFEPGVGNSSTFLYNGQRLALRVCEDIWGYSGVKDEVSPSVYRHDPLEDLRGTKNTTLIVSNGSPYYLGKADVRLSLTSKIAKDLGVALVYANQVGANDDLIFDGRSFALNGQGELVGELSAFSEDVLVLDVDSEKIVKHKKDADSLDNLYNALVLGTRDYIQKTGHKKVVIGLSGGIDSALTAAIAVDALGAQNVFGLAMPSGFSSSGSIKDAQALAGNLGIKLQKVAIENIYGAFGDKLKEFINWDGDFGPGADVTEENVQARIRGVLLMAYSNKTGALVLSTGNKSEIAVGYCTLYGDMAGGVSIISDVPKTDVYRLAKFINRQKEVIPNSTITKPPSAELRPDQKDEDSLPPYDELDDILNSYIEKKMSSKDIVALGYKRDVVERVIGMVERNEHKRKQMPIGLRVTSKAFGSGWRFPIAAKY